VLEGEDASTAYIFREKPFWARKLSVELLAVDDRERVFHIIRHVLVRPPDPAPLLPEFFRNGRSGFKFVILGSVMWGLFWAVLRYIERDHSQSVADLEAQVPRG
jgi:hypothetical protein